MYLFSPEVTTVKPTVKTRPALLICKTVLAQAFTSVEKKKEGKKKKRRVFEGLCPVNGTSKDLSALPERTHANRLDTPTGFVHTRLLASLWVLSHISTKTSNINRSPPSKFSGFQPSPRLRRLLFPLCISEASRAPAPLVPSWASNLLGPLYLLRSRWGWGKSQINFGGRVGGSSRIKFWRVWSSNEFCFSLKRKRKKIKCKYHKVSWLSLLNKSKIAKA